MSKTITIPADVSRMEITINNKTYTYQGGATVTVPDEVAALIAANEANKPSGVQEDVYDGEDFIPVYKRPDGTLCIRMSDVFGDSGEDPIGHVDT